MGREVEVRVSDTTSIHFVCVRVCVLEVLLELRGDQQGVCSSISVHISFCTTKYAHDYNIYRGQHNIGCWFDVDKSMGIACMIV